MRQTIDCAYCGTNNCYEGGDNRSFVGCPMNNAEEILLKAARLYNEADGFREIAHAAALVESRGYMRWTRVEETIEFARLMKFKKLGVACCIGLRREAAILESILKRNGFDVVSAICKTGAVPKEKLGVEDHEKVHPGRFEAMCNPIAQAMLLDGAGSELNIVVGLCVGHDALFTKTSKAPATTLVTKDRVLCHNPAAALYNHQAYYQTRLYKDHQ